MQKTLFTLELLIVYAGERIINSKTAKKGEVLFIYPFYCKPLQTKFHTCLALILGVISNITYCVFNSPSRFQLLHGEKLA